MSASFSQDTVPIAKHPVRVQHPYTTEIGSPQGKVVTSAAGTTTYSNFGAIKNVD